MVVAEWPRRLHREAGWGSQSRKCMCGTTCFGIAVIKMKKIHFHGKSDIHEKKNDDTKKREGRGRERESKRGRGGEGCN